MNSILIAFLVMLGASIGSFLNAAVYRLAVKESIAKGRSRCVHCGKTLPWYDLFPVFSYLALKGQCRACDKRISVQYILVEVAMAALFGFVAWKWGAMAQQASFLVILEMVRDLLAVSVLVFLFVFDLKYFLLPDIVTLPSILVFLIINLILGVVWWTLLLAIVIGAGFFALQFVVSKGKWIGGGDIRFGGLMGAILGWPNILVGLFGAYFIGAIVGLGLLISGKKKFGSQLPFGTFLAIGTAIGLWWGNGIISWYLGLI